MFRMNPNDIKKQLRKLGIKNVNIKNIEAEEVIIRTLDGKELVAVSPNVVIMEIPGSSVMIQVLAAELREQEMETTSGDSLSMFNEEDVNLVMEQTGASKEEAIEALREAGGDIAAAIMLIEERRRASEAS